MYLPLLAAIPSRYTNSQNRHFHFFSHWKKMRVQTRRLGEKEISVIYSFFYRSQQNDDSFSN